MPTFARMAVLAVLLCAQANVTWGADLSTPPPSAEVITPLPSPHDRECARRGAGIPACRKDCSMRFPAPNPNTYCDVFCADGTTMVRGYCIIGAGGSAGCPGRECTF